MSLFSYFSLTRKSVDENLSQLREGVNASRGELVELGEHVLRGWMKIFCISSNTTSHKEFRLPTSSICSAGCVP